MKLILKIISILVVAAIVAAGFSLAVNGGSLTGGTSQASGQPPAFNGANGQFPDRPDGGERDGGGSLGGGLAGILISICKIGVITSLVLLAQKMIGLFAKPTAASTTA